MTKQHIIDFIKKGGLFGLFVLLTSALYPTYKTINEYSVSITGGIKGIWKSPLRFTSLEGKVDSFCIYYLYAQLTNNGKQPYNLNIFKVEVLEENKFQIIPRMTNPDKLETGIKMITPDYEIFRKRIILNDTIIGGGKSIDFLIVCLGKDYFNAKQLPKKIKLSLYDKIDNETIIITDFTTKESYMKYSDMEKQLEIRFNNKPLEEVDSSSLF